MANILNSPSKYVQGAGELSRLGKYAEGYGKKALILISASGYKRIGSMVEESFSGTGCSTIFDYFNGECCKTEINRLIEVMEKEGCDMVIGIGGGKILDTSKAVAYYRHTPVIICPTIASTDAPCSALSVIYTENGVFEEYLFLPANPNMVLMDTEVIAKSPARLTVAGMGEAHGVVGENLGTEAEAIRYGSAAELAGRSFAPLSVLLVENFDLPQLRAPGFPDESFIRSEVPMTKQEVRAAALAKLAVMPTDTLWDVGAGTGSVSVELALAAPKGRVYAVECEPDACELIRKNRAKFHACNLILIEGRAPDVLADLPAPDAVFIGGTKGGMEGVLDAVLAKNPDARICISAIALETLGAAIAALTARGLTAEVTQIAVSRTKPAGRLHLLMANNPIFLITGTRK